MDWRRARGRAIGWVNICMKNRRGESDGGAGGRRRIEEMDDVNCMKDWVGGGRVVVGGWVGGKGWKMACGVVNGISLASGIRNRRDQRRGGKA